MIEETKLKAFVGVAGVKTSLLKNSELIEAASLLFGVGLARTDLMVVEIDSLGVAERRKRVFENFHLIPRHWVGKKVGGGYARHRIKNRKIA